METLSHRLDEKNDRNPKSNGSGLVKFPVERIRLDFPILETRVYGHPLVYLDNGATTQKPQAVIDCMNAFYEKENANIHRGIYPLSEIATERYENVRKKVQNLIHARSDREIIFTKGTTEGINLVAQTYGKVNLAKGDEVLISHMEHHSNIVPWQMLCEEKGALLRVIPIDDQGQLVLEEIPRLLTKRTKILALTYVSNSLGTVNPVKEITRQAHLVGAKVLIDAAQAISHLRVDVQDLDCDFLVFSGHKFYGPTGVGVLYGKRELLEEMPPYQGGGDMIRMVSFEKTTYNDVPHRFEAGTPAIAEVIGLGATVDYFQALDFVALQNYERELLDFVTQGLQSVKGLRIIGQAKEKAGVVSFILQDVHPHDVGTILAQEGICVRAGHHCAQPVMKRFGIAASVRASVAFYNTREEIEVLLKGLDKVKKVFAL